MEESFYHQECFLKTILLFINIPLLIQKSSPFLGAFLEVQIPLQNGLYILFNKEKVFSCFLFSLLCMHIVFSVYLCSVWILISISLSIRKKIKYLYVPVKAKQKKEKNFILVKYKYFFFFWHIQFLRYNLQCKLAFLYVTTDTAIEKFFYKSRFST